MTRLVVLTAALFAVAACLRDDRTLCHAFAAAKAAPSEGLGRASRRPLQPPPTTPRQRSRSGSAALSSRGGGEGEGGGDATDGATSKIRFYTLKGGMCPYAARTHIVLLELGLPFEAVEISGRDKPEWFLKINPRGKVPAIENSIDATVVYESAICDEYLSDLARETDGGRNPGDSGGAGGFCEGGESWKLAPVSASERAVMRLLNDRFDTQLAPAQYTYFMNRDESKEDELRSALEDALDILEDALSSNGGPFLLGRDFTLSDVHVLPFYLRLVVSLRYFKEYEVPTERFPLTLEWFARCSERESVKELAPSNERIVEVYQMFRDMDYSFGGLNKNKK